jgi:hypothetical protein
VTPVWPGLRDALRRPWAGFVPPSG